MIIRTGILLHTSKTIAPRVKSQARGQKDLQRALKQGVVSCSLKNTGNLIKNKKYYFFKFLHL